MFYIVLNFRWSYDKTDVNLKVNQFVIWSFTYKTLTFFHIKVLYMQLWVFSYSGWWLEVKRDDFTVMLQVCNFSFNLVQISFKFHRCNLTHFSSFLCLSITITSFTAGFARPKTAEPSGLERRLFVASFIYCNLTN